VILVCAGYGVDEFSGESAAPVELLDENAVDVVMAGTAVGMSSEWEILSEAIASLLGDVSPAELTAEDVDFLAGASGCDPVVVRRFAAAHRLAREAEVAVEPVYALLARGAPADLPALAAVRSDAQRTAVAAAIAAGIVPPTVGQQVDSLVAGLESAAVAQPTFLVQASVLYVTTAEAAIGESEAAKLINARLDEAFRAMVRRAVGTVSAELGRAVSGDISGLHWQDSADKSTSDVARASVVDAGRDPRLAGEAARVAARLPAATPPLVRDELHLHEPVCDNPVLADDLARGKAVEYARLAGLGDAAIRAVVARSASLADGDAGMLSSLVDSGSLTVDEASALRGVLELAKLGGDNLAFINALDTRSQTSLTALARWDAATWIRLIDDAQVPLPPSETPATYAENIVANLETTYPTLALAGRLGDAGLDGLLEQNPSLDLRVIDLVTADAAEMNWGDVAEEQRPELEQRLRACQRVLALADTSDDRATLLNRGYDSSITIATETEEKFVASCGLSTGKARLAFGRAQVTAEKAAHAYAALRDLVLGQFKDLAVGNVYPALMNELQRIDGFSDLFGSQDFCACDECLSVLSPAAYFCDLMHFVEKNVSQPVFVSPGLTTHPLYLKVRRPDLWTLELTCENTNTLVPYLTIVNEVLETFLDAVVAGDIYKTLADPTDKVSFRTPVDLPFAELRLYLSHFGLSPADVYRTLQLADGKVWRARLGVAPEEANAIATFDPAGALLRLGNVPLANPNVQEFLRVTGLTRGQLDGVLALRSNPDLQAVVVAKTKTAEELQNFQEVLENLTDARVDFIHRFLRLWRASPWQIDEIDLLVLALREGGLVGADLDENLIEQLGQLVELQTALHLTVEELCALPDSLPVSSAFPLQPARQADRRLYERLFDLPKLFGLDVPSTGELNQSILFLNPAGTQVDPKMPLLLGGLGISQTELLLLFDLLKDELPFDPNGQCELDRSKLSLLYRHVRLARALQLSIDDLIRGLQLLFEPGSAVISSLDQIRQLVVFSGWLRRSPFTTSELRFVLDGIESAPVKYANTIESAAGVVLQVQGLTVTPLVDALRARLAALFNVTADRINEMLGWTAADITASPVAAALAATFTNGVPDDPQVLEPLLDLIHQLERVATLFSNLRLTDDGVEYLSANGPALGISNLKTLTLHDVQSLTSYRLLATVRADAEPEVVAALAAYLAAGTVLPGDDRARLADLWQVDVSLVDSLVDVLSLPTAPIDALTRLAEGLALCETLGVDGHSLQLLGDDASFADIETASEVALGSFSSKYQDETLRANTLEPYQDQINVMRRDALCDYLIARRPTLNFRDHSEIYDYFLLDVDMSGCFRTSRVVAAISSVQLYVQRCLLNLEETDPSFTPKVQATVPSAAADQWEWRKNYRVWQANRKVFLYPESYIDPDLRDDKTSIALDLEDDLLQRKITKDSAVEAYEHYLAQFAELAHLRICGSLRHGWTYYFLGRSQQDPANCYCRRWDGTTWTPWQKIDVAIDAPYIAAEIHLGRLFLLWVETKSKDHTTIANGGQQTDYYDVAVGLAYSMQTPEGKWTPKQKVDWLYPSNSEDASFEAQVPDQDTLDDMDRAKTTRKVYPKEVNQSLVLRYFNPTLHPGYADRRLDLFHNKLRPGWGMIADLPPSKAVLLYPDTKTAKLGVMPSYPHQAEPVFDGISETGPGAGSFDIAYITASFPYDSHGLWAAGDHLLNVVHNGYPESVFTLGDQQYLIREPPKALLPGGSPSTSSPRTLVRLSTSRADDLGEKLMAGGFDVLFELATQQLTEKKLGMKITDLTQLQPPADDPHHLDFGGAFGGYYREVFLHMPWLVGFHLNANQQFEDAKTWYERIFNPTARESADDAKPSDRNWRYVEFRDLAVPTLKEILTDGAAISAYENDPFNPYAIARLRPTAFQKAIVMNYLSNLMDWGDSLFAEDTMESINEAEMLYVLARDILAARPAELGACDAPPDSDLTYERIGPAIEKGSEFLVTLENWSLVATSQIEFSKAESALAQNGALESLSTEAAPLASIGVQEPAALPQQPSLQPYPAIVEARTAWSDLVGGAASAPRVKLLPGLALVIQTTLVFCVPPNDVLLAYWDRVEDRLFKIRNCMNLSGVRRQLALFAPPINPMDLVRAKAAGLSLEDALAALAAPLPPYRFSYLIERARQATQTVQSFGAALLSALEKKDVEDLTLLRSVHEQTLLRMTKDVKTKQVEEAQSTLQALEEAKANIQERIDYLQGLIAGGLSGWEVTEQTNRHTATSDRKNEQNLHLLAAGLYLIPEAGSPFAMTFGGRELGSAASLTAEWMSTGATILEAVAASAGLEATFQRRNQEWRQSLAQAQGELRQVEQQRLAAVARVAIAEHDLDIHQTTIDQAGEIFAFYGTKFTKLGLYNYLATTLTRLHREAYNVAHDLAALAERSYRFESDDDTVFVAPDNWQFDKAGLLAGERLMVQLQQMEFAYLQQNTRRCEVTQSFSLALVEPAALLALRATGVCAFSLGEILFDLAYPGHYKRLIKSVRVTIPCIAGPYTNVSAKLALTGSQVRSSPQPDANLEPLLLKSTSSICTSTAQNDSGVFELNFRDERYLPFEGWGAISDWSLELPAQLRLFDYNTIADVLIHISYTALDDGDLRDAVQANIVGQLTDYASDPNAPGLKRLFSLRHDFPNAFQVLLHPSGGTQVAEFDLGAQHFPYFLAERELTLSGMTLYLEPTADTPVDTSGLSVTVNGTAASPWTPLAGTALQSADVPVSGEVLQHWSFNVTGGTLDPANVEDVLILIEYVAS
jgi:hypothetical protein